VSNSQKGPNSGKSSNSQTNTHLNPPKKEIPALWPTSTYKLSMTSTVWNISAGQLGLAAWLPSLPAPPHPLIS